MSRPSLRAELDDLIVAVPRTLVLLME